MSRVFDPAAIATKIKCEGRSTTGLDEILDRATLLGYFRAGLAAMGLP